MPQSLMQAAVRIDAYDYFDAKRNINQSATVSALVDLLLNEFPSAKDTLEFQPVLQEFLEFANTKVENPDNAGEWNSISVGDYMVAILYERYGDEVLQAYLTACADGQIIGMLLGEYDAYMDYVYLFLTLCTLHGIEFSEVHAVLDNLLTVQNVILLLTALLNIQENGVAKAHEPWAYLAWMDRDQAETFGYTYVNHYNTGTPRGTTIVSIACPVDVTVYDQNGDVVAVITNHQVSASSIPVLMDGETIKLYFAGMQDNDYSLEIVPVGSGTMTYTVTELNQAHTILRRINYYDIDLEVGQVFTGDIYTSNDYGAGMYDLSCIFDGTTSIITPSEVLTESYDVTVNAVADGPGSVKGAGIYVKGDTIQLYANGDENAKFVGWYNDHECVSTEAIYRFCVTGNVTLTAKFVAFGTETPILPIIPPDFTNPPAPTEPTEPMQPDTPFTDVPDDVYYADAVEWAINQNVTTGTSEATFSPDNVCTRAQAVAFLWRAAGCPAPTSTETSFADVSTDEYYYDAVLWAVENGITNGTSATTFSPDIECTRAQIVTFLWRSQKSPVAISENPFVDVTTDDYYYDAVLWAVENGITTGISVTAFSPNTNCTRSQIVTFLWRCLGD